MYKKTRNLYKGSDMKKCHRLHFHGFYSLTIWNVCFNKNKVQVVTIDSCLYKILWIFLFHRCAFPYKNVFCSNFIVRYYIEFYIALRLWFFFENLCHTWNTFPNGFFIPTKFILLFQFFIIALVTLLQFLFWKWKWIKDMKVDAK